MQQGTTLDANCCNAMQLQDTGDAAFEPAGRERGPHLLLNFHGVLPSWFFSFGRWRRCGQDHIMYMALEALIDSTPSVSWNYRKPPEKTFQNVKKKIQTNNFTLTFQHSMCAHQILRKINIFCDLCEKD
jgi:hypothetical protein